MCAAYIEMYGNKTNRNKRKKNSRKISVALFLKIDAIQPEIAS